MQNYNKYRRGVKLKMWREWVRVVVSGAGVVFAVMVGTVAVWILMCAYMLAF